MLAPSLVEAFRRGEDAGVRAVYREFGRLVYTVAHRVLGERTLAEEAAQQTFVQAWRAASSFEEGRELGPWLATIARRVSIDIHRREARRQADSIETSTPAAALSAPAPDAAQLFETWHARQAVEALDPQDRELIRLHHVEGYSQSEIAERLGLALGTVKSRMFRIHRSLATALRHLRDQDESGP